MYSKKDLIFKIKKKIKSSHFLHLFLKSLYLKLNNLKILKKYYTKTGIYYLPFFALDDVIKKDIINNKIYQENIVNLAKNYIKENSIILDAGANFGQMSILFSKIKKNVTVYAFEGQEFIFSILKKNFLANKINGKCFYNLLSDENKIVKIEKTNLGKFLTWGSNNINICNDESNYNLIKSISIDSLNITRKISFFKIDVQGMDLKVMRGAKQTILKNKMPIIFEYEEIFEKKYNYSFSDFENFIHEINYKIFKEFDNNYLILPK
ncbi:FkbM family methyltransferase [Candidatus Pelagibacter sp. HIMB1517]|uniref:FkbM family methyltransferase n=1 Tax=Candidatus Pelagibacter sp. HIMB1517 TaxID=3413341 RepID=UPI003F839E37